MSTTRFILAVLFIYLFISLVTFSCSKNPIGGFEHQEIPDVEGLILLKNGVEIIEIAQSLIIYGDRIDLVVGPNGDEYEVWFLDENGDVIDLPANPYQLCVSINGSYCVCVEPRGEWKFNMEGLYPGETKMCIRLYKEDPQYFEYQAPNIPVEVK